MAKELQKKSDEEYRQWKVEIDRKFQEEKKRIADMDPSQKAEYDKKQEEEKYKKWQAYYNECANKDDVDNCFRYSEWG